MYFALAATYPVSAGLGGGGLCLIHDGVSHRNEGFDFLARDVGGHGAFGVPGNVRGFSALQAAYGRLPWRATSHPAKAMRSRGSRFPGHSRPGFAPARTPFVWMPISRPNS